MKPKREYEGLPLRQMIDFHPKRNPEFLVPPKVRFAFFKNKTTGKLYYRKYYVLDNRRYRYPWQKAGFPSIPKLIQRKRMHFHVILVVRRQGKTWGIVHDVVDGLFHFPHNNPIGNYYCLEKQQALRNASEAIHHAILNFPGAFYDDKSGTVTIPWPTLKNPANVITFYQKGTRGGEHVKRGDRSDITALDELDGFPRKFINTVGIVPTTDHDGIMYLSGTDFGDFKNLEFYLNRAKKYDIMKEKLAKDEIPRGTKLPADLHYWSWYEADAFKAKRYSKEKLEMLKSVMGEEDYNREFMNIDASKRRKFYFRHIIENPHFQANNITDHLKPVPNLPFWVYYDLGIGNKNDKMALILVQHLERALLVFWGTSIVNATIDDPFRILKTECPYQNIPISEHVLPHDGDTRDYKHQTPQDLADEALHKYQLSGETRVRPRPTSKLIPISRAAQILPQTSFHETHAEEVVEALSHHRRKEIADGVFSDMPAKTTHRDVSDCFCLAASDHHDKDYSFNQKIVQMGGKQPLLMTTHPEPLDTQQGVDCDFFVPYV